MPKNIEIEVKLEHSHIIKRSDGIIEIRCANDFTYDVEHIKENHAYLKEFAIIEKALVLNFTENYTSITNEARNYIAKGYHKDFIAAEAFLIHSLPQRLLANFYIKLSNPIVPAAYFAYSLKNVAENWLLEHKRDF